MNRVLDIESGCLSSNGNLLCIDTDRNSYSVLYEDIAAVLITGRASLSHRVLVDLAEVGAPLCVCDTRFMPVSISIPFLRARQTGHIQKQQWAAPKILTDGVWRLLVQAKIRGQAALSNHVELGNLAESVTSGDIGNLEAIASRKYWLKLFGNQFSRGQESATNAALNYGYTIVRASVIRALCASGLNPSIGIHHSPTNNPFCLADDLMEPLRPLVDKRVITIKAFDKTSRVALAQSLCARIEEHPESRTIFDISSRLCYSFVSALNGGRFDVPAFALA